MARDPFARYELAAYPPPPQPPQAMPQSHFIPPNHQGVAGPYELTPVGGGAGSAGHPTHAHLPPHQHSASQHTNSQHNQRVHSHHHQRNDHLHQRPEHQLQRPDHQLQHPHHRSDHHSQQQHRSEQHLRSEHHQRQEQRIDQHHLHPHDARKRKSASYHGGSDDEDDTGDDARSSRTAPDKKQNHSEIEKRRRDKMNTYITELSSLIPMCGAMARKLDKLTVLRMAVQHLRSVRGALTACPLASRSRPAFLSEQELNGLILQEAHSSCFLLVLSCDRGRLLYVSASVRRLLHYDQGELLGQSLFDILHPKDVAKVKEQLSSSDLSPRERLIDAKTMLPVKAEVSGTSGTSRLCPGARRSFFCRIKCKPGIPGNPTTVKEESDGSGSSKRRKLPERKYCVVHFTGYLKAWAPIEVGEASNTGGEESGTGDEDFCNMSCLVAVGRALSDLAPPVPSTLSAPCVRRLHFVSRHATDGKFLFVDQRVTPALGFLPQELLGTSIYEYVSGSELAGLARAHKGTLLRQTANITQPYSFRRKDGTLATIQTHFKPFRNPWTKDVECLVANNTLLMDAPPQQPPQTTRAFDMFTQDDDLDMQQLIDSQVESHKIGSAIAQEVLRRTDCSENSSPDLSTDLLQEAVFTQQVCSLAETEIQTAEHEHVNNQDSSLPTYSHVRNNVSLAQAGSPLPPPLSEPLAPLQPSPPLPPLAHDGNDEAAMAVIMSLLEADAGLGGPVDFSGLPWPLP